jgi:hypothetical protein
MATQTQAVTQQEQVQQMSSAGPSEVPVYEIDQNELEIVFNKVVSNLGGVQMQKKINEELKSTSSHDRVAFLISQVLVPDNIVTGCKVYKESLMPDGTYDTTHKTVVVTSYLNLKFLGLQKMQAKKVLLSHQMRQKLTDLFSGVSRAFASDEPVKLLMFKKIVDQVDEEKKKRLPAFVREHVNDFVFLKVIVKLPN